MSYLSELGTIFFDVSMPTTSMIKQGKNIAPATFKNVERLCNQIILEPEVRKTLFRTVKYSEEQRLKDISRLINKAMPYFPARDASYNRVLDILKNRKLSEEQRCWAWRVLCVVIRYMAPSRAVLASLKLEGLRGGDEHVAYVDRHIKLAKQTSPTYLTPTEGEVKFTCLQAPFVKPIFGVRLDEIDESLLVDLQGVKLPKILVKLGEAILRWNGCSTEGLFRIPSDLRSFEDLKHSLERGEYCALEGERGDAIAAANLLKSWLRSLDEPLIPSQLYPEIVGGHCSPALVMNELPEQNRNTLRCVLTLLQTVSIPTNQSGTRMSVDALATVFAPNLIRGTEIEVGSRGSEWTRRMSEHSKIEQSFICQLIKRVK